MRVTTDDPIYRVKGVWIDLRGSTMPVIATYTQWGIGALLSGVAFVFLWLFGRVFALIGIDGWFRPFVAVAIGATASWLITSRLDGERSLRDWIRLLRLTRASRRQHRKATRTRTVRYTAK